MSCLDCADREPHADLLMVAADLGDGAFLAVLCETCWHRRKYRAELRKRLGQTPRATASQLTSNRTPVLENDP